MGNSTSLERIETVPTISKPLSSLGHIPGLVCGLAALLMLSWTLATMEGLMVTQTLKGPHRNTLGVQAGVTCVQPLSTGSMGLRPIPNPIKELHFFFVSPSLGHFIPCFQ